MAQSNPRSLNEIKRETEQARAGLTDTVDQLRSSVAETADDIRQRIQPDAIKAEVSNYIRTRGEQLMDDVTAAAKRNPMQAVAIGATVAYPLLRLARTIPVPVLMVGAGLYLAGSKTGQKLTQQAGEAASDLADNAADIAGKVGRRAQEISEEAGRRVRDFGDQLGERTSAAKAYVGEGFERASDAVSDSNDELRRRADAAGAAMASGAADVEQRAASLGASVADRVGELKDKTVALAGATADAGIDAAKAARAKAADLTDRAGRTFTQTFEQNPLLVTGIGLLIGGLIASALPRTNLEDELIGSASNAAKRRAREAASQGFEAAKAAAGEAYDNVATQAEAEGLTPDAIGKVAQTLGQRVRRVADTAVNTAFDPSTPKTPANGESNHG